ncbi:methyltransferase domain-containing protein [Spongiactinospora gelatinilytica]|nr:methyltransferase domain-containing protein [Spongiactinospora gelatinilytica]
MEHLIASLDPEGDIGDRVKAAVRAVPRDQFIPPVGLVSRPRPHLIDRDTDPDGWWDAVYSDTSIVTQLDDGTTDLKSLSGDYTSSASAPSTVADLLQRLELELGHRVLEIGTGTGWTAALLSHLVGEQNVTSIEVDAAVAEQAAKNLSAAGHTPHLVVGDGTKGAPDRAPFDRVHVTCGIRQVPYAWVEQTRPGGVIVLPWCPEFGTNHTLRLVVLPDGIAHGRFPGFASYMLMRSQRMPGWHKDDGTGQRRTTRIDPRTIGNAPPGADLAIAAITGLRAFVEDDDDGYRLWVVDTETPSQWAAVTYKAGAEEFPVYQLGDRPVWDEAVDAYFRWVDWGEPRRDRFGMTVSPDGQQVWLDTPQQVIG